MANEVKRYSSEPCRSCYGPEEAPAGEWVAYEDHAADRAALVAQLEAAREIISNALQLKWFPRDTAAESEAEEFLKGCPAPTHAALVAQLEEMQQKRNTARDHAVTAESRIDALVAQVAELTRERAEWMAMAQQLRAEVTRLTEALAAAQETIRFADEQRRAAEARVRELEAENRDIRNLNAVAARTAHAAESECAALRAVVEQRNEEVASAGDRIAALRAEVERLRTDNRDLVEVSNGFAVARNAAESRLAAANALLERRPKCVHGTTAGWERRVRAHLAAQPATAPAAGCVDHVEFQKTGLCRLCGEPAQNEAEIDPYIVQLVTAPARDEAPGAGFARVAAAVTESHEAFLARARAEAERRVLDACAAWHVRKTQPSSTGQWSLIYGDVGPIADAVLALRGLK